jgi:hypothetical protein
MTVEEFKNWWFKNKRPIKIPFKNPIHDTDIACAIVLYREMNYQVEMYICKPNKESTPHTHPGIDSINMYLTGDLGFKKGDGTYADLSMYQKAKEDGTHALLGCINEENDGSTPHTLKIGSSGGSFLIFQKWNRENPSSVAVVYDGESLGEIHDKVKRISNVE